MLACVNQVAPALSKLLQSERLWNDLNVVVRSVYPALLILRLADKKTPGMDKLYFYVRQMDEAIVRSKFLLDSIEEKYQDSNNNFSKNKMMQYFLQTNEISDYCNEFSRLLSEADDDDDDEDDDDSIDEKKNDETKENEDINSNDDDDDSTTDGSVGLIEEDNTLLGSLPAELHQKFLVLVQQNVAGET